jgi:hypothetical protein
VGIPSAGLAVVEPSAGLAVVELGAGGQVVGGGGPRDLRHPVATRLEVGRLDRPLLVHLPIDRFFKAPSSCAAARRRRTCRCDR